MLKIYHKLFIVAFIVLPSQLLRVEADAQNGTICPTKSASQETNAVVCSNETVRKLDEKLDILVKSISVQSAKDGDPDLNSLLGKKQADWLKSRDALCSGKGVDVDRGVECLKNMYQQRIDVLSDFIGGEIKTAPGSTILLSPGQQIGMGGPAGSDYWAIAQCGVNSLIVQPGGSLASTGASVFYPADGNTDLPILAEGLGVDGDMNKTSVICNWASGGEAEISLRLSRPITEGGPCAGNFGVIADASINGDKIVSDQHFLGYCGLAIVKSFAVINNSVRICTLSSSDDPERKDPVNALPLNPQCKNFSLKK